MLIPLRHHMLNIQDLCTSAQEILGITCPDYIQVTKNVNLFMLKESMMIVYEIAS